MHSLIISNKKIKKNHYQYIFIWYDVISKTSLCKISFSAKLKKKQITNSSVSNVLNSVIFNNSPNIAHSKDKITNILLLLSNHLNKLFVESGNGKSYQPFNPRVPGEVQINQGQATGIHWETLMLLIYRTHRLNSEGSRRPLHLIFLKHSTVWHPARSK